MQEEISNSLITTLKKSDLSSLSRDFAEIGVDALVTTDGIFKELPIISSIYSVMKAYGAVNDYLLMKKVNYFLFELRSIPALERFKAIADIEGSTPEFGESLMLIISQCNNSKKPIILGRILACYVSGKIDLRMLHNLYHAVTMLDITQLGNLRKFYLDDKVHEHAKQHFVMCGLAKIDFERARQFAGFASGQLKKNEAGEALLQFLNEL